MRKRTSRVAAGFFASLFVVFAFSASQPMPVCAAVGKCSEDNTVTDCNDDLTVCCTKTKKDSKICDCFKL